MPRTKNSKVKTKKSEQSIYSELTEILWCDLIDCRNINGDSIIIYQKHSDKNLNCRRVHPSVNTSIISHIKKMKKDPLVKHIGYITCWIAIWKDFGDSELYIKNIAASFEDLIQEVSDMNLNTAHIAAGGFVVPVAGEDYLNGG